MKNPARHHTWKHSQYVSFAECSRCAHDKAVCQKKIRFDSYAEADEWVNWFNVEHGWRPPLMTRYVCRWCAGWHMKTAKDKHERVRMQRQCRKWMIATGGSVDQEALLHWVRTGKVFVRGNDIIDRLAADPLVTGTEEMCG